VSDRFISGPQGRLAVSVSGESDGAPLLFVHADAGTRHHWDDIGVRLSAFTTAAFDRRGHGQSEAPQDGAHDHTSSAEDIAAIADALGFERFILVAHSGGALNAYTYALAHSARLAALVLVDPPTDAKSLPPGVIEKTLAGLQADCGATIEAYYRTIAGDDRAVADRVIADARATRQETVIGCFKTLSDFPTSPLDAGLASRTLAIIQSQFDVEGALHRVGPGFRHVAIDGAGHWIQLGAPDRFVRELRAFIGEPRNAEELVHAGTPNPRRSSHD
jgi:pimeloyl-ACP methyl ester carboxylesterase